MFHVEIWKIENTVVYFEEYNINAFATTTKLRDTGVKEVEADCADSNRFVQVELEYWHFLRGTLATEQSPAVTAGTRHMHWSTLYTTPHMLLQYHTLGGAHSSLLQGGYLPGEWVL